MKPTPQQLRAEITTDPVDMGYAASWASGNDTGTLAILSDPTRRTRLVPRTMSLTDLAREDSGFAPASVAAVFQHARFPDFRDVVNKQDRAGAVAMASLFHAVNVITADDLAAFVTYATTPVEIACSRLDELGWAVTISDVGEARQVQ